MARPDDLEAKLEQAINLVGEAEFHEQNGDLEKALPLYEEAAHLLTQASVPSETIEEMYARIQYLKDTLQQQKLMNAVSEEEMIEKLEEEAFEFIEQAENAIRNGDQEAALKYYGLAIPRLQKAGYPTKSVEEKLQELQDLTKPKGPAVGGAPVAPAGSQHLKVVKRVVKTPAKGIPVKPAGVKPAAPVIKPHPEKPVSISADESPPTQVAPPAEPPVAEVAVEKVKAFQEYKDKRAKAEELEAKAFQLIDEAKTLTEQERYVEALSTYDMIKSLLKNAGWDDDQLEPIEMQVSLVREIMDEQAKAKAEPVAVMSSVPVEKSSVPTIVQQKLDKFLAQDSKIRQRRQVEAQRYAAEAEAFELINQAQKLYKHVEVAKDYPGALELYRKAVSLLRSAGWTDQIDYLIAEMERIKELHARELRQKEMEARLEKEKEEMLLRKQKEEEERQKRIQENIMSISSLLGKISRKKEEKEKKAIEQEVTRQVQVEHQYKGIVASPGRGKTLDTLKDLLFSNKDAKKEEELKKLREKKEEEFLSSLSKEFFALKQKARTAEESQDSDRGTGSMKAIIDHVHEKALEEKGTDDATEVRIIDMRKKQEIEMKREQEMKETAVGEVLSMLSSIKEKKSSTEKKEKDEKTADIKDKELEKLFDDLKKKQ